MKSSSKESDFHSRGQCNFGLRVTCKIEIGPLSEAIDCLWRPLTPTSFVIGLSAFQRSTLKLRLLTHNEIKLSRVGDTSWSYSTRDTQVCE